MGSFLNLAEKRELSSYLTYRKVATLDNVMNFGDSADNFYIILKGVASVMIPNKQI
jgi:hypothetical protein